VSKAFTREDADAGFDAPAPSTRLGTARLTRYGARLLRERLRELEAKGPHHDGPPTQAGEHPMVIERMQALLADAEIIEPAGHEHIALGAHVRVRSGEGRERELMIVTADEVGVVPSAISAASPLAHALIGAQVGETVEFELPRGVEELTVVALDWPV
jgi:transcription elongation GreA/GreB family factor